MRFLPVVPQFIHHQWPKKLKSLEPSTPKIQTPKKALHPENFKSGSDRGALLLRAIKKEPRNRAHLRSNSKNPARIKPTVPTPTPTPTQRISISKITQSFAPPAPIPSHPLRPQTLGGRGLPPAQIPRRPRCRPRLPMDPAGLRPCPPDPAGSGAPPPPPPQTAEVGWARPSPRLLLGDFGADVVVRVPCRNWDGGRPGAAAPRRRAVRLRWSN
jgi:hypothetical protein